LVIVLIEKEYSAYMECPIEHKTPEECSNIINEVEASTVEELPDTTEEE
jgi:hypothetical protein